MSELATAERIIDVRTFWQAVGLRAVGTAIVTAEAGEGPRGFLALSATHICADPPLMAISVDKKTSALATIFEAAHFAINYLSVEQADIALPFSGKGDIKGADRFKSASWTTLTSGAPVLENAAGVIDCVLHETIERYGTVIALGRVVDFTGAPGAIPLISYKGKYL